MEFQPDLTDSTAAAAVSDRHVAFSHVSPGTHAPFGTYMLILDVCQSCSLSCSHKGRSEVLTTCPEEKELSLGGFTNMNYLRLKGETFLGKALEKKSLH